MAYVPSAMQSSCSDVGADSNTGADDLVQCHPQAGVEVDYYQFSDQGSFSAAWNQLTNNPDQPYQSGDCHISSEQGSVTSSGSTVGQYACPSSTSNPNSFVWDSTANLVIAAIQAPSYYPADLLIYWQGIKSSIY